MSVPKNKRTENKLQALKETLDMVKYTIQMCDASPHRKPEYGVV